MMITAEGMGRRATKDGDEVDYLTGFHRYVVCNHGVRGKVKTANHRRTRRQVRMDLRTTDHEEG
jgi:hypothetical protein